MDKLQLSVTNHWLIILMQPLFFGPLYLLLTPLKPSVFAIVIETMPRVDDLAAKFASSRCVRLNLLFNFLVILVHLITTTALFWCLFVGPPHSLILPIETSLSHWLFITIVIVGI